MNWLPIKEFEGLYEVSDTGLIRSVDRIIPVKNQKDRFTKGKVLSLHANKKVKYLQTSLWKNNKETHIYVHRIVAETFIDNPKNLPEVNHIDGNRQNNNISNLEWVDRLGNITHAIKTNLRTYTHKLSKQEFLECLYSVLQGESYASLSQRIPYKVPFLSVKLRKLAKENNLETELNIALYNQKLERAKINGIAHRKSTR